MDTRSPPTNKRKRGRNLGAEDARQKDNDEAFGSSQLCEVCGEVSSEGWSFLPKKTQNAEDDYQNNDSGRKDRSPQCVSVCQTCQEFYQRSVQSKSHLFYICTNNGDAAKVRRKSRTSHRNLNLKNSSNVGLGRERGSCPLNTGDSKNRCPSCWYQKCVEIGMNSLTMTSSNNNNLTYTNNNSSSNNNKSENCNNTENNSNNRVSKSKNIDKPPCQQLLPESSSSTSSQKHSHHEPSSSSSLDTSFISTATSSSFSVPKNLSSLNNSKKDEINNSKNSNFTTVAKQQQHQLREQPEKIPSASSSSQSANPDISFKNKNNSLAQKSSKEMNPSVSGNNGETRKPGTILQSEGKRNQPEKNQVAFPGINTQTFTTTSHSVGQLHPHAKPRHVTSVEVGEKGSVVIKGPEQPPSQQKKGSFSVQKQQQKSFSSQHNNGKGTSKNLTNENSSKSKTTSKDLATR